ncbi:hypothetical protein D3C81_2166700 [compost metagenome]
MGGVVGTDFTDYRHRQAIEDAALLDASQAQADIARMNFATQCLAQGYGRVGDANAQIGIR